MTAPLLAGRAALLTGATGCLGRAIAAAYGRAGARLLLSSKGDDQLQMLARELSAEYSIDVAALACDLTQPDEIVQLVSEAERRFGGVDILVNAAAVIGTIGETWEVDWEEWRQSFTTNLFASVRLCQLCIPLMPLSGGRGKIVNISGGGATSPRPRFSAYASAKSGLVRFTETLAYEVNERSIDVNCIAPGVLNSTLTQAVISAGPERAGRREYEAALKATVNDTGNRHRAAELALFLGSPSSDGISGRLLSALWDDWSNLRADSAVFQDPDVYTLRRVTPKT